MKIFKRLNFKLSPIQYILSLATIVYFFLAVLTYHPDNKQVLFWASIDGVKLVDVWKVGAEKYPTISQFNYPPAHYVVDKFLYFIAKPIAGEGYDTWLAAPNDHDRFTPQLAKFTLATKFGLILLGILSGYLMYLLVSRLGNKKQALTATALWLFNPITLYSLPMMGQNDVIAICFFLLGWLTLQKRKVLATLFFGIATSVKMIPIIWLPFLLASTSRKNWIKKLFVFIGSGLIYVLTILPFLNNPNFQKSILSGNHNQRFLFAHLSFGFSEAVYIIPILLMILLAGIFTHAFKTSKQLSIASFSLMIVNMTMLSFTHFHPQWWMWVVLFWSMWMTTIDSKKIGAVVTVSLISFACWLVVLLLFDDKALTLAMLMPLNPGLVNLPTIRSVVLAKGMDIKQLVNLAYTWLAGISVIAVGGILKSNLPDIHEEITVPKTIKNLVNKIYFNGVLRKISIATTLLFIFIVFTVVSQVIPAPLASKPPEHVRYQPLTSSYQVTFKPEHNNLNRFDLYLSDVTLQATGGFLIESYQGETQLSEQVIQGENIGFESIIRFDTPTKNSNKMNLKDYTIKISPISPNNLIENKDNLNIVQVGITNSNDPKNSLAIRPYFETPKNQTIFTKTFQTMKNVVSQTPFLFVLIGLMILIVG